MNEQTVTPQDEEYPLAELQEAPASMNFYGVTKNGWNVQFTLRDWNEHAMMNRFAAFVGELTKWGVTPKAVGQQPKVDTQEEQPKRTAQVTDEQHSDGVGVEHFEAETLVGSMNEGKTFWKVKGGKFSQYGISIWPEVLKEAGFNVDDLNPAKTYPLSGRAYYQESEKDGKTVRKVTRLVKV